LQFRDFGGGVDVSHDHIQGRGHGFITEVKQNILRRMSSQNKVIIFRRVETMRNGERLEWRERV
jgi:hypothetical protein